MSVEQPFGHAGTRLHEWMFDTAMGHRMFGREGGSTGVDNDLAEESWEGIGCEIMGRGKFHTASGPIPPDWEGYWGPNPPFHTPVVVLTRHPREDLAMEGGTTFHFRDADPAEALAEARRLAGDLDVRLGGGVRTLRTFLDADLVDHLHVVVVPVVLGRGERLWDGLEGLEERLDVRMVAGDSGVTHVIGTRPSA
ncbi:dihydrofolate reductase family protein [Phycicoccus flavus]|uniref:dihydrofolate reductase family protein n=1 Tax=Phycicoccus flavus TaxID=2502783 RepID=UPI0026872CCC|nr:dihydrofolate reductase family protein [Phycicoccus flavus]